MKFSLPFPPAFQACALLGLGALCQTAQAQGVQLRIVVEEGKDAKAAKDGKEQQSKQAAEEAKKAAAAAAAKPAPKPTGPHLLELADTSRLHGTIESIDTAKQSLLWRHPAASAPLPLPITQLRRLSFGEEARAEVKVRACIKFLAGGWLAGDIRSIDEKAVQIQTDDGSQFPAARDQIEWIYFSKKAAPECFDGPNGLSGWSTNGIWTYRDGALRPGSSSSIQRRFESLPDLVEYRIDVDQGPQVNTFNIILRGTTQGVPAPNQPPPATPLPNQPRDLKITRTGAKLRLNVVTKNGNRTDVIELNNILGLDPAAQGGVNNQPANFAPMRLRLLQDYTAGRIFVYINDKKAAEWVLGPGEAGKNGNTFLLEPAWSMGSEQAFSKLQILPWDGVLPKDGEPGLAAPKNDRVLFADGKWKEGRISRLDAEGIVLQAEEGEFKAARDKVSMVRFAQPGQAPKSKPTVAQVRLVQRGDFDAASLRWHEGKLVVETTFGAELTLAPSLIGELQFVPAAFTPPPVADTLVFRDGDRLPGLLDTSASTGRLQWRRAEGEAPVDIDSKAAAGVLLGARPDRPAAPAQVVALLRNGDWIDGKVSKLTKDQLTLETPLAGTLQIARAKIHRLYFSTDKQPAISDGASEPEEWQRTGAFFDRFGRVGMVQARVIQVGAAAGGAVALAADQAQPPPKPKEEPKKESIPNYWTYLNGAFSVAPTTAAGWRNQYGGGNVGLSRIFDSLPSRVEIAFDVSTTKAPIYCNARIFSEGAASGYMLDINGANVIVRDIGQEQRRVAPNPLQRDPDEMFFREDKPGPLQRRIRIFVDRMNDSVTVYSDGTRVSQIRPRTNADVRTLGKGIYLNPYQPTCGFSNLWVSAWSGRLPDEPADPNEPKEVAWKDWAVGAGLAKADKNEKPKRTGPLERVLLANGDEAQGTVTGATGEALQMDSDIGPLTLEMGRLSLVDFGGTATETRGGTRLRLAGRGSLMVSTYSIANNTLTCQSEILGELKMPLSALQELNFPSPE